MTGETVTCECITCGEPVTRPKKAQGRHARFCSLECKLVEKRKTWRRWKQRKSGQTPLFAELVEPEAWTKRQPADRDET